MATHYEIGAGRLPFSGFYQVAEYSVLKCVRRKVVQAQANLRNRTRIPKFSVSRLPSTGALLGEIQGCNHGVCKVAVWGGSLLPKF